jgi:hypothetical protein
MPNWCENDLTIVGSTEIITQVMDFVKPKAESDVDKKTVFSLHSIYPTPQEMLDGDGWYNWRINNWGTKWDVDAELADDYEYEGRRWILIRFESAWGPPQGAIEKLAAAFPEISIHHSYDECGMDFSGYDVYKAGEMHNRFEYGFSVSNATSNMEGPRYFEWNEDELPEKKDG